MYDEPGVQKQVLSAIPLKSLEEKSELNAKQNNTAFKDELVKSLLYWYKKEFFSWCDSPKCSNCSGATKFLSSQRSSTDEAKHLASNTEIYKCGSCNYIGKGNN